MRLHSPGRSSSGPAVPGFTLVEVLLAIGIASALLVSAMLFYRQAADLRTQILTESDRLATMRRVLDRMASDLRSAQVLPRREDGFSGGSNWMSFARLTIPSQEAAASLKRVTYAAPTRADGTNTLVAGISRVEESPDAVRPAAGISRTGLQSSR